MQEEHEEVDPERARRFLRRRAPWVLLCVVLAAGAAFAFSKQQTEQYTAAASLVFSDSQLNEQIAGLQPAPGSDSQVQQGTNVELVQVGDTAKTANLLGRGLTKAKVDDSLSISATGTTNVVNVSATSSSPQLAAAIANTFSRQFVRTQRRADRRAIASALAVVEGRLAALSPEARSSPAGLTLEGRAQSLAILAGVQSGGVQVAQRAAVPTSPSSPEVVRNTIVGAVLGLLIGLGIAFLLESVDHRIKEPKELEAIFRLPLLGVVPQSRAIARSARRKEGARNVLPPGEAESFRMIRAHIRFFNVDRDLRTFLVVSAAPGDGKTTVAHHLAEADAAARVQAPLGQLVVGQAPGLGTLLIEADLRGPTLAQQLAIESGPGLADVLSGGLPLTDALQSIEVGPPSSERHLDVLVAGAMPPPNPGELLESRAMQSVLEQARNAYQFVVIDTPPLAAVSDAFPLMSLVDGIIVVGRVGQARRDVAEQLCETLRGVETPLLGVVANGVKAGGLVPYAYGDAKNEGASPAIAPSKRSLRRGLNDGQATESSDVHAKAAASNYDK